MTLHCLYAGAPSQVAQQLLNQATPGDAIVLLGDAVELAASDQDWNTQPEQHGIALYALKPDLQTAGIATVASSVTPIDYTQWVDLSVAHRNQRLWR